jgi:hypothetical protein
MATFQIQTFESNERAAGRGPGLKMENITKNKLCTVTGKNPRIIVE